MAPVKFVLAEVTLYKIMFFFFFPQMPVCQFFLRGTCSNDNCPYSHVNVSKKAEVCEDFLKGFCALGQQVNINICRVSKGKTVMVNDTIDH